LLLSLFRFPLSRLDLPLLFLALLVVAVSSSVVIRIPLVSGGITVSDTFIFLTMLLYGGEAAVLLAVCDGLFSSLRISRRPRTIFFNSAVMACSTFLTVWTLRTCFGSIVELPRAGYTGSFIGAIWLMALTQYAANSGLIAAEKAFKTDQPFWKTWRAFYLWTSVTYIAGASAAGIIAKLIGSFGFYAVTLTAPIVAIIYLTYRTYQRNIEASRSQAEQAERHVEELNHYLSELKRAEEERDRLLDRERQARSEAESANRIKDEFLATLSHELRTPLASILGWANLLRAAEPDGEISTQGLEVIERNAQNQRQLIDDLLDVSRIITGQLRLDVRQVDLTKIVADAVEVVGPAAKAKSIQISCRFNPPLCTLPGDPVRLQQVVWNLLVNAVKFTPEGGRIEVTIEQVDHNVRVSISDNGQGITPEFLPHVFDRFRQADGSTTRAHGGLGLGLAIVRHLVEAHGGTVSVESSGKGRGAVFFFSLPLPAVRTASEGEPANRLVETRVNGVATALSGVRVLVVDDDTDARQMISAVLKHSGAEVRVCCSAGEALTELPQWRPDVLMSDIGMPYEDGYDLIHKVRALTDEHGGRVPAAALTAYARDEDRQRAIAEGYQMHVAKPASSAELVAAVATLAKTTL
ncbi:MAG TPA: ATP-binding protein, partial [Pyrinomonadaceae bacterium]|nr:ATP-binding protein [Pyrinomonadaceae bacterium]